MNPVEIIALILVLVVVVKIITLMIKPKAWLNIPKNFAKYSKIYMVLSLVLAGVVLYYLLTQLTIVDVFASVAFTTMMVAASFAAFPKELSKLAGILMKKGDIVKKAWLVILIWLVICAWVLYTIFA